MIDLESLDQAVGDAFGKKPGAAPARQPAPAPSPAGPAANLTGLDPELSQALDKARNAYRERFGKDLPIASGVRTRAEQERLFNEYKAGKPNVFSPLDPSKYPGQQTFHTDAVDIPTSVPETFLNEFGIHRPLGRRDPVHAIVMPRTQPAQGQPAPATQPAPAAAPAPATGGINLSNIDTTVNQAMTAPAPAPTTVTGKVAGKVSEFLRGQGRAATSLLDTGLNAVTGALDVAAYPLARAFYGMTMPPEAAAAKATAETTSPKDVFGRAFGVAETPEYKAEASRRAMEYIGAHINEGVDAIQHGLISMGINLPKADVENMVNTTIAGVTPTAGRVLKREAGYAAQAVKAVTPEPVQRVVAPVIEAVAPGTTKVQPKPAPVPGTPGAPPEAPGMELRRNAPELQQRYQAEQQAAAQGQAPAQPTPAGSARPTTPDAPFAEVKYGETGLPLDEQYARAQTLNRVLGADHQADLAAIEGKGKERATNYATSNTDTATGNYLKERFADEQRRLADYAERQVKNTGGTVGLDESTVYKRGNTILKPLQDLETYFDNATRKIYADRDAIAQTVPVEVNNILRVLNDESLTLANTETIGLTNIAKARMKQLGMIDKDGNPLPTNAKTAENFRKFLNENWDRKNSVLHKQLKAAVDEDVLSNLDTNSPLYKDARALVELRKNTLDNPNGISKILDAEGPKGINRKVDIEKIAQNIINMPVEQFTHVVDTLRNVPKELQPQAGAALSEIKAQFANRVAEQKTPRQLTKYMNDNREVMARVFTPDEMNALRDYHNAVHILATDTGYKGAAVQKINVEQKLGSKIANQLLSKGGAVAAETATGGVGMGVPALVTHELLSQRAARSQAKAQAKAETKAFENTQSRFVPIQDLLTQGPPAPAGKRGKQPSERIEPKLD
jgi:hypothetical protein